MIFWFFILKFIQLTLSSQEPCLDYVHLAMRQRLENLPLNDVFSNRRTSYNENQYDIILQRMNCVFNHTENQSKPILSRSRQSGRLYQLIGNDIFRMVFDHTCFRWSHVAVIEDSSNYVGEFEIDEIVSTENKTVFIAALYLDDRFKIYQIPGEDMGNNSTIKPIQKIRRPGTTTKTYLLQHSSNVYLITGYMDSDSGKIAVYRWMNFHFSVEDVKDVPHHTNLIVHAGKQLVILVFDSTDHPDRSTNHIYVLNEQRKIVKTQEMYFLYHRMPYYVVDDDLYILRCLAIDKCFLYKWNGENLFLRISKFGINPKYIEFIDNNDNIIVLSLKNELFFYRNQPLLKVASAYAIIAENGPPVANHISLSPSTTQVYLYKETQGRKTFVFLVGNRNEITAFEMKLSKQERISSTEGEQDNFNALKTNLKNIKTVVNIRKGWIDLMKYQMTKIMRACKNHSKSSLSTILVFIAESNAMKKMSIKGEAEDHTSLSILRKWISLKSMMNEVYVVSQYLFYMNKANAIHNDMKIQGNLHTKNVEMKSITIYPNRSNKRFKRKVQSVEDLDEVTVNVKEITHSGIYFKGLIYRTSANHFPLSLEFKNIYTRKITSKNNTINIIPLNNTLNISSQNIHKGFKMFKAIETIIAHISKICNNRDNFKLSILRNILKSAKKHTGNLSLSGTRDVSYLIVTDHLNDIYLEDFFKHLYYAKNKSIITGNIYVREMTQIRNIHGSSINTIEINKLFNLRTNQTIASSIYMQKVYAKAIYNNEINRLSLSNDVIFIGNTQLIRSALVSNLIIFHDLILSNDDLYVNYPVLGTKIEDFSHIYLGNVYIKGSLIMRNTTSYERSQIAIKDQLINNAIRHHFWMKHMEQDIFSFAFHRHVVSYQLLSRKLNYQSVNSYMRIFQWNLHSQNFSKVHVSGDLKLYAESVDIVHHIYSEAIARGIMSTVFGKKVFDGRIHIDSVAVEYVGFTDLHKFVSEQASIFTLSEFKQMHHLNVVECTLIAVKKIDVEEHQSKRLLPAKGCNLNIRDIHQVNHLIFSDVEVLEMNTTQINGKLSESFALEITNIASGIEPSTKNWKIENFKSKINVISTNQVFLSNLNEINIEDYFRLLASKGQRSQMPREIGGCKVFSQSVIIDETINAVHINGRKTIQLIKSAARKSNSQNIVGLWFATSAEMKYLTTKQINNLSTRNILNTNLRGFTIAQNLMLETFTIHSSAHGLIFPKVSSITIPNRFQLIDNFVMSGSFIMEEHLPKTYFFDVLTNSVRNDRSTVDGKVVFRCKSIEMIHFWNDGSIVGHGRNFLEILTDTVIHKQNRVTFSSDNYGTTYLVCQNKAEMINKLNVVNINNLDYTHLETGINTTKYPTELIGSAKIFVRSPDIIELKCSNQFNEIVHLHNLTQRTKKINAINYKFEKYLSVLGSFQLDAINKYSIQHFILDSFLKNQSVYNDLQDNQAANLLIFSTLELSFALNAIQTINQIPLEDVTYEVSSEHQAMQESKQFDGQLSLQGPASVIKFNNFSLLDKFKLSYWLNELKIVHEDVFLGSKEILLGGILIDGALDNVSVITMTKLRLSSVEELLPLLPNSRNQLLRSSNAFINSNNLTHIPYYEDTRNSNISVIKDDEAYWNNNFNPVVEKGSKVLAIMSQENNVYQKIMFSVNISSVEKNIFQGAPAIWITTEDGMFYLYVLSTLEGWTKFSYGKI